MELKEFISQTLTQIINGVLSAQESVKDIGGEVNPIVDNATASSHPLYFGMSNTSNPHKDRVFLLEFDIAVDAEEAKAGKVGGGIFLASFGLGAQSSDALTNKTVNRIKFVVPYLLPTNKHS